MIKAKGILETCLYVDDLDAAEEFYGRVLGLELYGRMEGRHAFFRCGKQFFLLFHASETQKPGGNLPSHGAVGEGHVGFCMELDEASKWQEQLERNKVTIEHVVKSPKGLFSIYFRDPSGNSIELVTQESWDDL